MKQFLDKLNGVIEKGGEYMALCPAHDDDSPSLSVKRDGGKILLKCMGGCDTVNVLAALRLNWDDLEVKDAGEEASRRPRPELDAAEADFRHRAYTLLIGGLSLAAQDRASLRARGLTDGQIDAAGYRTLAFPGTARGLAVLSKALDKDSAKVPGVARINGAYRLTAKAGLLVPVRDHKARVVGCQVRTGEKGRKYVWLSSRDAPSGSPCHVPALWQGPIKEVWVTEGPLKADVATSLGSALVLGVGGLAAWASAMPVLAELGPGRVVLACDMDAAGQGPSLADFAVACQRAGHEVAVASWERHKGLDDALLAGVKPAVGPWLSASAGTTGNPPKPPTQGPTEAPVIDFEKVEAWLLGYLSRGPVTEKELGQAAAAHGWSTDDLLAAAVGGTLWRRDVGGPFWRRDVPVWGLRRE